MAQCANEDCGRSDLVMADVRNFQCLACGSLTDIETGAPVVASEKPPLLSNAGLPVRELSVGVVTQPAHEFVNPSARQALGPEAGEDPDAVEADDGMVPAEAELEIHTPKGTVDLSHLSPEQLAEVEKIANEVPGGSEEINQDQPGQ